jgi:hypothetical protein
MHNQPQHVFIYQVTVDVNEVFLSWDAILIKSELRSLVYASRNFYFSLILMFIQHCSVLVSVLHSLINTKFHQNLFFID